MALNPYYSHYNENEDVRLTDELIIEAIQMKGLDFLYLMRDTPNFQYLYGEDPTSAFTEVSKIEGYPVSVNGFDGDGELMSKFGLEIRDSCSIVINKTRFREVFGDNLIRPREGDILYMPITRAILEIKYVNHESPFFQQGRQLVYEIRCETFSFSHEDIHVTPHTELDEVLSTIKDKVENIDGEFDGDGKEMQEEDNRVWNPSDPFGVN